MVESFTVSSFLQGLNDFSTILKMKQSIHFGVKAKCCRDTQSQICFVLVWFNFNCMGNLKKKKSICLTQAKLSLPFLV